MSNGHREMNDKSHYRVNEIFYSLQGEGRNTGRAAAFVRFAGCNLRCPFCDTEFDSYDLLTAQDIVDAILPFGSRFVVLTGGEPTLQVDEAFVELLHRHGFEVAMESNGTRPAPTNIDWLTVSPKLAPGQAYRPVGERRPDELKVVFDEDTPAQLPALLQCITAGESLPLLYLQPCDTGNGQRNARIVAACIDYIKEHPEWRLSLQTHKLTGIR